MPYIDLYPVTISSTGLVPWTQVYGIVNNDNSYAIAPSGMTNPLYVEFYGPGSSNSLIPPDSIINGFEVFYSAKASGGVNTALDFNFYRTSSRTQIGSSLRSAVLTGTEVASSVGGTGLVFSFPPRLVDTCNFSKDGLQIGNKWFGVAIRPASGYAARTFLDQIYLRVHYTPYSYLVGSRSRFHNHRPDLGYDVVMVNGVAHSSSSYIQRKGNGTAGINQVRSHDVNLLGDSIYNIESSILTSSGSVYALDLKKTYVFSITVSATCDTANVNTDAIIFANLKYNGVNYSSNLVNIYTPMRSTPPSVSGTIMCYFTSAIAWLEHANRVTSPVYAAAQVARFAKKGSSIDFIVGVTALGSGIATVEDSEAYEGQSNAYNNYVGSLVTYEGATGKIFFKILAIGRET